MRKTLSKALFTMGMVSACTNNPQETSPAEQVETSHPEMHYTSNEKYWKNEIALCNCPEITSKEKSLILDAFDKGRIVQINAISEHNIAFDLEKSSAILLSADNDTLAVLGYLLTASKGALNTNIQDEMVVKTRIDYTSDSLNVAIENSKSLYTVHGNDKEIERPLTSKCIIK